MDSGREIETDRGIKNFILTKVRERKDEICKYVIRYGQREREREDGEDTI